MTSLVQFALLAGTAYLLWIAVGTPIVLWWMRRPIREDRADLRSRRAFVEAMTKDPERWS